METHAWITLGWDCQPQSRRCTVGRQYSNSYCDDILSSHNLFTCNLCCCWGNSVPVTSMFSKDELQVRLPRNLSRASCPPLLFLHQEVPFGLIPQALETRTRGTSPGMSSSTSLNAAVIGPQRLPKQSDKKKIL